MIVASRGVWAAPSWGYWTQLVGLQSNSVSATRLARQGVCVGLFELNRWMEGVFK